MNIYQEKIYNHLLKSITEGELPLNKRIPTENELSGMFGTNRMNAHFAVKELERFGVLRRNKGQGTFVNRIPSPITTGELKSVNTRRVCVLNHNCTRISKIHWNERIITAFKEKMKEKKIEVFFKDISHLNSKEDFVENVKDIAEEGYNSLLIVLDDFVDNIITENPEILFRFHNNVFIFDRGSGAWHEWPYNVVSINQFREGVIAAEYLLQKGYENIIFVKNKPNHHWVMERARGLEFGIQRETDGNMHVDILDIQDETLLDMIENSNKKYAVVAQNDAKAAKILEKALERKLKPGVDFALMGLDDDPEYKNLKLTTISPPLERIGEKLAELIIKNLDSKTNNEISTVRIDSELVIRKTC